MGNSPSPGDEKAAPVKERKNWIGGKVDDIEETYKLGKKLGLPGQYGYAQEAIHKKSGTKRAIKVINKARFSSQQFGAFRTEMEIVRQLDHPNIIKGFEAFETSDQFIIVMEYCGGGELFDRITAKKTFTEKQAQVVLLQIVEAVKYLHDHKIAHCDIKPDNLLFLTPAEDSPLKLIDFGMSRHVKQREYFTKLCGTSFYIAPEVLAGKYSYYCDIWSIGVIMFIMLFGYPPFHGADEKAIHAAVRRGFSPVTKAGYGPWFPSAHKISDSAKDLITKMLNLDHAARITAAEILEHPWMTGEKASEHPLNHVMGAIKSFQSNYKFKAALLVSLCDSLTDGEIEDLGASFKKIDKNGDGQISLEELKEATRKYEEGEKSLEVVQLMKMADLDGDGKLSYAELVAAAVHRKMMAKEERLWNEFCRLDENGDGKISAKEIEKALGKDAKAALELIREVDKNGDGQVDYDEFLSMWRDQEVQQKDKDPQDAAAPAGKKKE